MKRAMLLLSFLAIPVFAQEADKDKGKAELTDAKEIFKKADDACKAIKGAKYEAVGKGLGAAEARAPKVEGTAILVGWANGTPQKYYFDVKVTPPGSSEVKQIKVANDGDKFYLHDSTEKKAYEDIDPAVLGRTGGAAQRVTMLEFVHETPFSDEINGKRHEFKGIEDVAGEKCYHVFVEYAGERRQEADWYFSTKDFLPRRADRWQPPQGDLAERAGSQLIISKLVPDPKVDDATFKLSVPEGFTKVDDFAP